MIHIDPNRVFTIKDEDRTITYLELIEPLEEEVRPKTKEELRDLLWCFSIDEQEIEDALNSCE